MPGVRFNERKELFDTIRGWKKSYPLTYDESKAGEPMKPQAMIEEMDRALSGEKT